MVSATYLERQMTRNNPTEPKSDSASRVIPKLKQLTEACELLDRLMKEVPGSNSFVAIELPEPIQLWLGSASHNTIVNVVEYCLARLIAGDHDVEENEKT